VIAVLHPPAIPRKTFSAEPSPSESTASVVQSATGESEVDVHLIDRRILLNRYSDPSGVVPANMRRHEIKTAARVFEIETSASVSADRLQSCTGDAIKQFNRETGLGRSGWPV
jgi:hypothetical protein